MSTDNTPLRHRTRRDVLRILAVGGAAGVAWKTGLFGGRKAPPVTRARVLMGTGVHLTVLGDDLEASEAAADATLDRMSGLEAILSAWRPDSPLSRLNATGRLDDAPADLLAVLERARWTSELGDGAFDVTVQPLVELYRTTAASRFALPEPEAIESTRELVDHRALRIDGRTVSFARPGMRITIDGVGKGYVVDRGVDTLRERGFPNVFVEAGGDLVAAGGKNGDEPWRIGIRHPRAAGALQARFDTRNRAVATSGDYMQPFAADYSQHHILDPRTGRSAPELASATVIAADGATADALATLAMVLGARRSVELLEELPGCEGYFVAKDLGVTTTSGFSTL